MQSEKGALNNPFGKLYTLGYAVSSAGRDLDDLMGDYGWLALVVDIRYRPSSRWRPEWNKGALQGRWGDRYIHEQRLGNVNYHQPGQPIRLLDPDAGVSELVLRLCMGYALVLLCACANYESCHRKAVVELLRCRWETF